MSGQIRAGAFHVAFEDVDGDVLEFLRDVDGTYSLMAYEDGVRAVTVFELDKIIDLRDVLNQAIATDSAVIKP